MQAQPLVILLLSRTVDLMMEMLATCKHAKDGPVCRMLLTGLC